LSGLSPVGTTAETLVFACHHSTVRRGDAQGSSLGGETVTQVLMNNP
jgi:hypothetical protein